MPHQIDELRRTIGKIKLIIFLQVVLVGEAMYEPYIFNEQFHLKRYSR